ncbi:MAG: hypothetical protein QE271_09590 [Bacteriovoracaceae bacterium]|nr:hypothetical protein [Bacteriovoracaceae bacterium]
MSSMDEDTFSIQDNFNLPGQELDFLVQATLNQEVFYSIETTPYFHTIRLCGHCSTTEELCQNLKIEVEKIGDVKSFPVESVQVMEFLIFHFHGRRISNRTEPDFFNREKQVGWFLIKSADEMVITWDEDAEILLSSLPDSKVIHLGPLHMPSLAQKYFELMAKSSDWENKFLYDNQGLGRAVFILSEDEKEEFLEFWLKGNSRKEDFAKIVPIDPLPEKFQDPLCRLAIHYFLEEVRVARKFWLELGIQHELN